MNYENKRIRTKLIPILLPGSIYIIVVFAFLFFIMSDNLNKYFSDNNGILVGSRWFSYQYTGDKYFHPTSDEKYIVKSEAAHQLIQISKIREYSKSDTKLVDKLIDSFAQNSSILKNGEKQINTLELNIKIDKIR
jgi:K+-transporting ATPase c subunit